LRLFPWTFEATKQQANRTMVRKASKITKRTKNKLTFQYDGCN
jgi:hypothetical protein